MTHWCWPQFVMTHETCSTYSTYPKFERWDYSDILGGSHKKIRWPAHMAEGGHHLRKAPNPHPLKYARHPSQIAKFMGPTWGPPGSFRPQMGPLLAPWTLLSGVVSVQHWNLSRITSPLWWEPPVDSHHKGPVMRRYYVSFFLSVKKTLKK